MRINQHPAYDDVVVINGGDQDLKPIYLSVKDLWEKSFTRLGFKAPKMPMINKVDFYNLSPNEQYFKIIHTYPDKLRLLEDRIRKDVKEDGSLKLRAKSAKEAEVLNRFWETLNKSSKDFKYEIEYIRRLWYFRLFGYWFFNNGIPTYITGPNFMYLYYYHLRSSAGRSFLPDYRDRDRRWFLFQLFAQTDTTTFAKRDVNGFAIPEDDGTYEMVDIGLRTCFGTITSKPRRVGDTSKVASCVVDEATRTMESQFGNQAVDDLSAERIFLHYINTPFNKYPLIFKPLQTQINPKAKLEFTSDDLSLNMGSWVDFATSKNRSVYDGTALRYYYADEAGKVKHESIKARHGTVKLCLSERDIIYGFTNYTTTVEEMDGDAAAEFMELSKDSIYHQRKDNGQTPSGLYVCFFPAYDGHPSYIDKFGMSVVDTPTAKQAKFIKNTIGCREYILNQRKILRGEALALAKRQDPITYRECFSPDPKNQLFTNVDEMQARIVDLKFDTSLYRKGNYEWEAERFGKVRWVDDREGGRFIFSLGMMPHEVNQVYENSRIKYPKNPNRFVSSADTFRLEKTDSSRMSKGGFAAYWMRDYELDPEGKSIHELLSDRFILSYLQKPETLEEFAEDCLMACIYCGIMMYPENNINLINEKFIEWGYAGYLLYDTDPYTGKPRNNAGFSSTGQKKSDMFNLYRDYLKSNVERDLHYDILEQAMDLRGLDDLKNKDLLTAAMGCLLAKRSSYSTYLKEDMTDFDTTNWIPQYKY